MSRVGVMKVGWIHRGKAEIVIVVATVEGVDDRVSVQVATRGLAVDGMSMNLSTAARFGGWSCGVHPSSTKPR